MVLSRPGPSETEVFSDPLSWQVRVRLWVSLRVQVCTKNCVAALLDALE